MPLTTQIANKGVATLLGIGVMMLHALESRTAPATNMLRYQLDATQGFAARPAAVKSSTTAVWPSTPVRIRC